MKQNFTKLIEKADFEFPPGFSDRVMEKLKGSADNPATSVILTERIGRMFYWINIPVAATLLIIMLLFFLNVNRQQHEGSSSEPVTLNEYVYDFYVSD